MPYADSADLNQAKVTSASDQLLNNIELVLLHCVVQNGVAHLKVFAQNIVTECSTIIITLK